MKSQPLLQKKTVVTQIDVKKRASLWWKARQFVEELPAGKASGFLTVLGGACAALVLPKKDLVPQQTSLL